MKNSNIKNLLLKAQAQNPAFRAAQNYLNNNDKTYLDLDRGQIDKIIDNNHYINSGSNSVTPKPRKIGNDSIFTGASNTPKGSISPTIPRVSNINIYNWVKEKREKERVDRL